MYPSTDESSPIVIIYPTISNPNPHRLPGGCNKPRYSTPELSLTVMGEPIISLRNPEGSEVPPVGASAGPFSVISGNFVQIR